MSDFKFSCPSCGQHVVCDTSNAGMQIPCPGCQTLLTVPQPPAAAPALPTVPAPGKLSINKSLHQTHSAPPPGTPKAPPAWGTKPPPAPPAKKSSLVPLLIGVVALAVLGGGGWFGYTKYQEAEEKKRIAAAEEDKRQKEAAAQAAAAARAKAEAARAVWKLDLADAKFPDRPAAGQHHGAEFKVETASFQGGSLSLLQTSGSARQFIISVPLKTGETLAGKTLDIAATNTGALPRVVMNWKDADAKTPGTATFSKGYALKLEFGATADGKLPGKIYLCVPDPEQSFVAGNFQIGAKTSPPANRPPRQPRPPKTP